MTAAMHSKSRSRWGRFSPAECMESQYSSPQLSLAVHALHRARPCRPSRGLTRVVGSRARRRGCVTGPGIRIRPGGCLSGLRHPGDIHCSIVHSTAHAFQLRKITGAGESSAPYAADAQWPKVGVAGGIDCIDGWLSARDE